MHVMNRQPEPVTANIPTPEQLAARQLRLLRQAYGWSQHEVAEKLRPYGYDWSQATVTRLESASRPIRLNELADLAALYGVKITQFLETEVPEDLEALDREIEWLTEERDKLKTQEENARADYEKAAVAHGSLVVHIVHLEERLQALQRWP